jgi:hypothetical protein
MRPLASRLRPFGDSAPMRARVARSDGTMSPFTAWRVHFETNRARPVPPIEAPRLPRAQAEALGRSLARFQLGESGEGRVAHEIDRVALPGVDGDYRAALKLFVAEEGRHAGILARMVRSMGGTLLARSWTDLLFVRVRRLFGVRFKLLVLLAAEVIGIGFYGLLAAAMPAGAMGRALEEICGDEEAHLRFHCAFLGAQARVLQWAWWPLGSAAALAVLWDHRHTLRAFGIPLSHAARRLFGRVAEAARRMRAQGAPARTQLASAQI